MHGFLFDRLNKRREFLHDDNSTSLQRALDLLATRPRGQGMHALYYYREFRAYIPPPPAPPTRGDNEPLSDTLPIANSRNES